MKLIDQVCTLSQAKRLKDLGIRQDASHAAWLRNECHKETEFWCWPVEAQGVTNRGYSSPAKGCLEGFSAFTVAEMLNILPPTVTIEDKKGVLRVDKEDECEYYGYPESYLVGYYASDKEPVKEWLMGSGKESLAQSAADILIMLLEHGNITVEEVNARLCAH